MKTKATPSDEPQHINKNLWYYETKRCVEIIQDVTPFPFKTTHLVRVTIPWTRLLASAKRCRPEEFEKGDK